MDSTISKATNKHDTLKKLDQDSVASFTAGCDKCNHNITCLS